MKPALKLKLGIAALLTVTSVAAYLVFATPAAAIIGVCTYYSNAHYKTVVGQRGTGCCGEPVNWGIVTPYRRCEQIYCTDVWCGPPTE
ncbi:MAG TPA: DUF6289 family protein [Candidatus Polarisedimenticolaceae bacterium]|nr:DUF6289 family protein [Candidatus Polarisedimenticolaceae bacterium]